jgi:hypothetical protein
MPIYNLTDFPKKSNRKKGIMFQKFGHLSPNSYTIFPHERQKPAHTLPGVSIQESFPVSSAKSCIEFDGKDGAAPKCRTDRMPVNW